MYVDRDTFHEYLDTVSDINFFWKKNGSNCLIQQNIRVNNHQ